MRERRGGDWDRERDREGDRAGDRETDRQTDRQSGRLQRQIKKIVGACTCAFERKRMLSVHESASNVWVGMRARTHAPARQQLRGPG